ncbi:TetR/AcrR family transcriptional regulator [Streptomyces flavofungini]|uniref:TetR/AcrR family transcriptional regulator n=1 Tax=Streptomyces flavofungini TaxID=68200 RepID=A0ABS0WZ98_9ACTN|nr:TetR/AcrR family transcriptional regulator [Streptomyces flavofungini]MBJ3806262.1 TetR/AcrR family transcriptional regulator [Streptomyces flavofungini]
MSRTQPTTPPVPPAGPSAGAASGPTSGAAAAPSAEAASAPVAVSAAQARADANRRRILDVAFAELTRDPDASMDQIARAAGVVRRTVYGHFPSRDALVTAILDEAVAAVSAAHAAGYEGVDDPPRAVASAMLAVWHVTDRYRLLISLAQRAIAMEGIRERLAPVHERGTAMLQRGLDEGRFVSPMPASALAYVVENIMFALMEAVNDGLMEPEAAGRAAAVTFLCAGGVPSTEAEALVAEVAAERASTSTSEQGS